MGKYKPNKSYFALLFLFWMILSESVDIQVVLAGMAVCGLVLFVNADILESRLSQVFKKRKRTVILLRYFALLCKEIVLANFHVAKIVLSPRLKLTPTLMTFDTRLESPLSRAVLANSITLTPGTLTVETKGKTFVVHCLMKEYAEGLAESKFEELLLQVEEA